MDFLIGFISGMMIGGWIGLFVACLIMVNKEEIFPKTPSQIFKEECEPYVLTRSELSIKDLTPNITNMCPTQVIIDGKIVWDDENGNDTLEDYDQVMSSDKLVASISYDIVHFHHSIVKITTIES